VIESTHDSVDECDLTLLVPKQMEGNGRNDNCRCATRDDQPTLWSSVGLPGLFFSRLLNNLRTSLMLTGATRRSVRSTGDSSGRDSQDEWAGWPVGDGQDRRQAMSGLRMSDRYSSWRTKAGLSLLSGSGRRTMASG
jgi:hypothetical protein